MEAKNLFKKNARFYLSIALNIVDGLLSSSTTMVFFLVLGRLAAGTLSWDVIGFYSLCLVGLFILRLILFITGYIQGQFGGADVSHRIRLALGDKIKRIPLALFLRRQPGHYINVVTANVNSYEQLLTHKTGDIAQHASFLALATIFLLVLYPPSGLLALGCIFILPLCVRLGYKAVRIRGVEKKECQEETIGQVVEYTEGIQTFRSYGMTGKKNKALASTLRHYSDVSYQFERDTLPGGMFYMCFVWCCLPAGLMLAGSAWVAGGLSTASFLMAGMMPMFMAKLYSTLFVDLVAHKNLMISKTAIKQLMDEPEEENGKDAFNPQDHSVCFKDVAFSYVKDEAVLQNVSFTAPHGSFTAIVGDSGAGKSTILNLIAKFYTPQQGSILIGGEDIGAQSSEDVLRHISMVDQDIFLFDDTVQNNIRLARLTATDEEVEDACKAANCHTFIQSMENGYHSTIGENGNQLSGGERQRLSIARAILKDSPILLLDEATASMDIENELAVRRAINTLLLQSKTVVMIAHTLSIVQNATQILVVEGGTIAEQGTHQELLALGKKYAAMWQAEQELIG